MIPRSWFFPVMAAVALFSVLVGFGRTYVLPMIRGTFSAPFVVHLHGVFALSWVLLCFAQPLLARYGALRRHRQIGRVALPLAIGVAVTMLPAGAFQATRDAAAGAGATGISTVLGGSHPACSSWRG